MNLLPNISLPLLATIYVVLAIGLSLAGLAIFHRLVDNSHLREAHDVSGFVYAVVGVIYAVLLAFVVIVVWEQWRGADQIAEDEASHLGNIRQLMKVFPDTVSKSVANEVGEYAQSVITREWPAMSDGHADPETYAIVKKLWNTFYGFRPAPADDAYYKGALRELTSFNDKRRLRIIGINGTIPPIMWVLLLGGGIICVVFTYLFATPRPLVQYLITALLSAMIAVTLFLVAEMDHPYKGGMSVTPDGFEFILHGPAKPK